MYYSAIVIFVKQDEMKESIATVDGNLKISEREVLKKTHNNQMISMKTVRECVYIKSCAYETSPKEHRYQYTKLCVSCGWSIRRDLLKIWRRAENKILKFKYMKDVLRAGRKLTRIETVHNHIQTGSD